MNFITAVCSHVYNLIKSKIQNNSGRSFGWEKWTAFKIVKQINKIFREYVLKYGNVNYEDEEFENFAKEWYSENSMKVFEFSLSLIVLNTQEIVLPSRLVTGSFRNLTLLVNNT